MKCDERASVWTLVTLSSKTSSCLIHTALSRITRTVLNQMNQAAPELQGKTEPGSQKSLCSWNNCPPTTKLNHSPNESGPRPQAARSYLEDEGEIQLRGLKRGEASQRETPEPPCSSRRQGLQGGGANDVTLTGRPSQSCRLSLPTGRDHSAHILAPASRTPLAHPSLPS